MYHPKRSLSEQSGAITLTLSLTAALLGAVFAMFRESVPLAASARAMRIFDVSAESAVPEPEPDPEPVMQPVAQPAAPVPSPVPTVVPRPVQAAEAIPAPPVLVAVAGPIQAAPAATIDGTGHPTSPSAQAGAARQAGKPVERREDTDQYGRAVFREIRARQSYPAELARAGLTGTVVVELKVSSRGKVYAVVVISSANAALDRLALAQVQAMRLPPPPRGEPRIFRIPMTYRSR